MGRANKKKKGLWWKVPVIVVVLLAITTGVYAFTVYNGAKATVDKKMNQQVAAIDTKVTKKKVKATEPLNILLLGVDQRANDRGRSDALMVLSLDPKNDRSQIVSIPRDSRTEMVGDSKHNGELDKINHAYAFGGADMSIQTVENFLDIDLDYYVRINMEGLSELVDAVGGVTIDNNLDWQGSNGFHYKKGTLNLDGDEALGYVRMRYEDPKGDLGRNERQRQIIQAVVDKGANVGSVNKIDDVLDVLGNNVATNLDFDTMKDLMVNYKDTRKDMTTYQMSGSGTRIGGIYYMQISDQEVQKARQKIQDYNS
ncbi:LCP family protein [Halobacillus sp. ACCC02827]|uniref:LCP family glycopolymer transferase n=1 Tax=Bacillaceae TaxID=186817 RepID=UPI0003F9BF53|nr:MULTISPECIES: LCP family protein [Bacillaceae]QHT47784.1 transcriptional regulator LytR [Bacillus sp. SB49]WJE15026.1 LCP family protein [Halobacillus sp. ACCC02827]